MKVICSNCGTETQVPDSIVPEEGIRIECPKCSDSIFVQPESKDSYSLNYDSIEMTSASSSVFGDGMSLDDETSSGSLDDLDYSISSPSADSLDVDIDIEPSIPMDTHQPIEHIPAPETPQKGSDAGFQLDVSGLDAKQSNQVASGTQSSQTKMQSQPRGKQHQVDSSNMVAPNMAPNVNAYNYGPQTASKYKSNNAKYIIIAAILLLAIGGTVFILTGNHQSKKNGKNILASTASLGLDETLKTIQKDTVPLYRNGLTSIEEKLRSIPNDPVLKASYVYIASRYFLSIGEYLPDFAPKYKKYYKTLGKYEKRSQMVKKAILYRKAVQEMNQEKLSKGFITQINRLPYHDQDFTLLKVFVAYKEKNLDKIEEVINQSKFTESEMILVNLMTMRVSIQQDKEIDLYYDQVQGENPQHIVSKFIRINYLLSFNLIPEAKKLLMQITALTGSMGNYELAHFHILRAMTAKQEADFDQAYRYMRMAEDLKLDNLNILKKILNFYSKNYYTSAALELLQITYKRYENDFWLNKLYVRLLIRDENYGHAGQICSKLRKKYPKNPEVFYLSALHARALKNQVKSMEYLKKSLILDKSFENAYVLLAKQYIEIDKKRQAIKILEDGIRSLDQSKVLIRGLAGIYYDLKKYKKAKPLYLQLVNSSQTDVDAEFKLAMIHFYRYKSAKKLLNKLYLLYKIDRNYKGLRISIAQYELKQKGYQKVIDILKEEQRIREKNPSLYLYMGTAYLRLEKYERAMEFLEKGLSYNSRYAPLHFMIGEVYLKLDKPEKAIDSFMLAYSYESKNDRYLYKVARTYSMLNRFTESLDFYQKLSNRFRTFNTYYEEAIVYQELGKIKEAIINFKLAYQLKPRSVKLLISFGDFYFKLNQYKDALKKYNQAIRLNRHISDAYFRIGKILIAQGKNKKAVSNFRKALRLEPKRREYYTELGYAYKELQQYKQAMGVFKKYLKNFPKAKDRKEIENEIYDLKNF